MIRRHPRYHSPTTVDAALQLLDVHGEDAAVIGGGTMIVPRLTRGERQPGHLLDLRRAAMSGVAVTPDHMHLGATTTYSALVDAGLNDSEHGLLNTLANGITGGWQIRNQGTIGGSAAYANPASDIPTALVALDATLLLRAADSARAVPARDFFLGPFTTALTNRELLVGIELPQTNSISSYFKFKLAESSWPIVTAACRYQPATSELDVTIGGSFEVPITRRFSPEVALLDQRDAHAELRAAFTDHATWTDALATGEYRRRITPVIAWRAMQRLGLGAAA